MIALFGNAQHLVVTLVVAVNGVGSDAVIVMQEDVTVRFAIIPNTQVKGSYLLKQCRRGGNHVAKLKWEEINFNTGYIKIVQEKTGTPLSLQMPPEVSDALLIHYENLVSLPEDGYVFHSMSAPYNRITTSIILGRINDKSIGECDVYRGIVQSVLLPKNYISNKNEKDSFDEML